MTSSTANTAKRKRDIDLSKGVSLLQGVGGPMGSAVRAAIKTHQLSQEQRLPVDPTNEKHIDFDVSEEELEYEISRCRRTLTISDRLLYLVRGLVRIAAKRAFNKFHVGGQYRYDVCEDVYLYMLDMVLGEYDLLQHQAKEFIMGNAYWRTVRVSNQYEERVTVKRNNKYYRTVRKYYLEEMQLWKIKEPHPIHEFFVDDFTKDLLNFDWGGDNVGLCYAGALGVLRGANRLEPIVRHALPRHRKRQAVVMSRIKAVLRIELAKRMEKYIMVGDEERAKAEFR